MGQIMTVRGFRKPEELGFCQCHEHLMIRKGCSGKVNPALCIDDLSKSIQEVQRFKEKGGQTIIDAQPAGCNRMAAELGCISEQTGVNIVASTGFHKLIFYSKNHWIHFLGEEKLTDIFVSELEQGMFENLDETMTSARIAARAGIIKAALDRENLSPRYERLFYCACAASIDTDTPVMVHIEAGADSLLLLDYMLQQGVRPEKIIFCHMDRAESNLDVHKEVLRHGVFLEYDTIGRFQYHSDLEEIHIFREMIDAGFDTQLLFSLDSTRDRLKAYHAGAVGLDYILNTFIPVMKKHGISETQIEKIAYGNPRRLLT